MADVADEVAVQNQQAATATITAGEVSPSSENAVIQPVAERPYAPETAIPDAPVEVSQETPDLESDIKEEIRSIFSRAGFFATEFEAIENYFISLVKKHG